MSRENKADENFTVWQRELPTEIAFWEYFFREADIPWPEDRRARLDPTTPLQDWVRQLIAVPEGGQVTILDVGAGPATQIGKVWPGRQVSITAIDPLADEYERIMGQEGVVPPVRTIQGRGEDLASLVPADTFDLACAINALDHSYDPLAIFQGMVRAVKPGGWVVLMHFENEAEWEQYQGLHQWNFCAEDGEFTIWNRIGAHIRVLDHLSDVASMRTEVEKRAPKNGLWVRIQKAERS